MMDVLGLYYSNKGKSYRKHIQFLLYQQKIEAISISYFPILLVIFKSNGFLLN